MQKSYFQSLSDMALNPPIYRLNTLRGNVFVVACPTMKIFPASHILDCAERRGQIGPGALICETSSRTMAHSLAICCHERGYKLVIVTDMDRAFAERLERSGATIIRVEGGNNIQQDRKDILDKFRDTHPESFFTYQYGNPDGVDGYSRLAEHIMQKIGNVDILVGPVGTGASIIGTVSTLREKLGEHVQAVACEQYGSVSFGLKPAPRLIGGMSSSIVMPLLDHSVFDYVHFFTAQEILSGMWELEACHDQHRGPTSGASYLAALHHASENPDATVVAILPDAGEHYSSTFYSKSWINAQGIIDLPPPQSPTVVDSVEEIEKMRSLKWSLMPWSRRSLRSVALSE